jgi:peptidoglycan hydrolase CwlO-like protein
VSHTSTSGTNGTTNETSGYEDTADAPTDAEQRLDALAKERATLQAEVVALRKSLEGIQEKHEEEMAGVQEQLEESQSGREHAEMQYRNLLGKVNTIKSQLGARLKENQVRMTAHTHIR